MSDDIKILCVDDEKNVLRSLQRLFMDEDYEIFTAETGEETLRISRDHDGRIDLVLMENVVPDIGELNLIKKLEPETKVIVYSGWDENGYAQKYINAGAHIFIKTPLTLPELLDTLKKVLK